MSSTAKSNCAFLFAPQPPPFQRPTDAGQAHGPTRSRFKPRRVFGQGGVGLLLNHPLIFLYCISIG
jgi:hypothetical protein